jgi:hypothetical protein
VRALPWVTILMTLDFVCWVATLILADHGFTLAAIGLGVIGVALAVLAGVVEEKRRGLARRRRE